MIYFFLLYVLILLKREKKTHKIFSSITLYLSDFGSCQLEKDEKHWEGKHFKQK